MSEGICPQCGHLASAHTYGCNYLTCECTLDKADIEPHPYPGVIEYSIYQKYAKLQDELEKMKSDNVLLRSAAENQPELDALNQAYENASRIASERLAENQQRRDENIKLAAENERLKAALEIYANSDNWRLAHADHRSVVFTAVHDDGYDIARAALEGDQ